MTDIRVRFAPVFPGFANVAELNLRTYVRVGRRAGIFFFSLDAGTPLVVRAARLATGLPYLHARIALDAAQGDIECTSVRTERTVSPGRFRARYRATGDAFEAEPGTLEHFLHERYTFFVRRGPLLFAGEVRHEPWRLQRASVDITENTLGDLASHALSASPACAFFSRALHVRAAAVLPLRLPVSIVRPGRDAI